MRTTPPALEPSPASRCLRPSVQGIAGLSMAMLLFAAPAGAVDLKVMATGVGVGTIAGTGIACGGGSTDCSESYAGTPSVTLTATPAAGSALGAWDGDCAITPPPMVVPASCTVSMTAARSVRFRFDLSPAPPALTGFTPEEINTYLMAQTDINTPARFISVLPPDFRQNWILMSRSESLQTGTAASPRVLLPSASALQVFTVGMTQHSSYPGAHPNAIEYMQWDAVEKNFRFHEIVLDAIPAMGDVISVGPPEVRRFPPRTRGVSIDDHKCFACHSTRNVLNRGTTPATDGIPPQSVKHKTKPNWDTYDSWGGMLGFNRDRIYQGSVEAAAFRSLFNPWTWVGNESVRSIIEQLALQPPGVPDGTPPGAPDHRITRVTGGADDGRIRFGFDPPAPGAPVTTEPLPTGSTAGITTAYSFDRVAGTGPATSVERGGPFVTLHHSTQVFSDEGRGVELFDRLSSGPNPQRVAHELANHRFATGSLPIDVRPIALAIAQRCITVSGGTDLGNTQTVTSTPALAPASTAALAFFNTRHGITSFNQLYDDTRLRAWSLPRRKADIQKIQLDRTIDPYVHDTDVSMPPPPPAIVNGLIQQYGAATSGVAGGTGGADVSMRRLRQEVFRRPIDNPAPDNTVMGGIYVDRELIINTDPLALYRYFLEPLGVSVDKWSMGVRGRSRTYTFADLFGGYTSAIAAEMKTGLGLGALPSGDVCAAVIPMVDTLLASLPPTVGVIPRYTDIQRILNKSCIECHGGLGYPPYHTYGGTFLDFSEDESPPAGDRRMTRSHNRMLSVTSMPTGPGGTDVSNSYLFQRITGSATAAPPHLYDPLAANEDCPNGIMPCGGPPLNSADIETIRRWIIGGRPFTEGDPHIKTVDGTSYDFQSAGEFVLLRNEGLEVQARQTAVTTAGPLGPNDHTGLSSCVSVNTAVSLRVGPHRVTYQPNIQVRGEPNVDAQPRPGTLLLRVDGKVMALDGREIVLASGGRIARTAAPGGIQINAPGGTVVVVTPGFWTHHQIWYMNIDVRHARASEGVMGAIAPGNWLPALPDGSFLGPRPASLPQRYQVLYEKFADAWRVTPASSLFDYEGGLSTASFTVAGWPMQSPASCTAPPQPGVPSANAPPVPLAREEAERLCRAVADARRKGNCITDVMATGEPTFAQTYLATEQIELKVPPSPPVLGTPKDFAEDLVRTVDFTWTWTFDADRGPLHYRHCIWSANEGYNLNHCKAAPVPLVTSRSLLHGALAMLLFLLVLVVLSRTVMRRKRWLLILVAILLLPAIGFYVARDKTVRATVAQLEPGKVYFWKVVAEDDQGGLVESQTRRLVVKR